MDYSASSIQNYALPEVQTRCARSYSWSLRARIRDTPNHVEARLVAVFFDLALANDPSPWYAHGEQPDDRQHHEHLDERQPTRARDGSQP
jgi:hypothetical protein